MKDVPLGEVSIDNLADNLAEYNASGEVLPSYILVTDPDTGETSKILEVDHV